MSYTQAERMAIENANLRTETTFKSQRIAALLDDKIKYVGQVLDLTAQLAEAVEFAETMKAKVKLAPVEGEYAESWRRLALEEIDAFIKKHERRTAEKPSSA